MWLNCSHVDVFTNYLVLFNVIPLLDMLYMFRWKNDALMNLLVYWNREKSIFPPEQQNQAKSLAINWHIVKVKQKSHTDWRLPYFNWHTYLQQRSNDLKSKWYIQSFPDHRSIKLSNDRTRTNHPLNANPNSIRTCEIKNPEKMNAN